MFIKKELPELMEKATVEKGENWMHSGGHNALIGKMMRGDGEYYICASNDMWYPADFVSGMVAELEKHENRHYGSATCKLMHWDFERAEAGEPEASAGGHDEPNGELSSSKTNIIDSCGITLTRGHHFFELGQGEEDKGQYDGKKEIFGSSGALAVYRKSALNAVAYQNPEGKKEYFDELLHYKNDVDMSYRLRWAGQKCLLIPKVKVWHDRQAGNLHRDAFLLRILKARKEKSQWIRENSFYGQLVVLKKNYDARFSFGVRLRTFFYKWASIKYALAFEPILIKQLFKIHKDAAKIEDRRKKMPRSVSPKDIESFMQ